MFAILVCLFQLMASLVYEYGLKDSSRAHISAAFESLRLGESRVEKSDYKQPGVFETVMVSALDSCYRLKWGSGPVRQWPADPPPFHICGNNCHHKSIPDIHFQQVFPSSRISAYVLFTLFAWIAFINSPQTQKYNSESTGHALAFVFSFIILGLLIQPLTNCLNLLLHLQRTSW